MRGAGLGLVGVLGDEGRTCGPYAAGTAALHGVLEVDDPWGGLAFVVAEEAEAGVVVEGGKALGDEGAGDEGGVEGDGDGAGPLLEHAADLGIEGGELLLEAAPRAVPGGLQT